MPNFTIEDYKKAIHAKYEKELREEKFPNPSQANLRNVCWDLFEKNENSDDLMVFQTFFGFEFDLTKRNQFKVHTDRFRPIGNFFKGKSDLADKDAANLAAVLVDFKPRPFRNFREKGVGVNYETQPNPGNSSPPQPFIIIDKEKSNFKIEKEEPKKPLPFICKSEGEESDFEFIEESENIMDNNQSMILPQIQNPKEIERIKNTKEKVTKYFKGIFITFLIFSVVGTMGYFAFFQKQCMQWSGDHYEKVSCDLKVQGIGLANIIEPLDETIFNLKKVKVCDTTPCFDKNGEAVIWYGKTANGIDFFDGHGRHPENNKPLRPVTQYILNKYVRK
ncbi:hypothetical protein [Flavobacterium gelatinilyticum]|uniref:hypothetical protein n=1 Tax=Flavobacterium gelatinilyticum TaxID=3003260 RepID=UPI0024808C63|nr:hypothetical protein [Flavobacterium gelatinilyticum]